LRRLDANRDGMIDPSEVPPEVRLFLESRFAIRIDRPMPIDELARLLRDRRGGGERREARRTEPSDKRAGTPLVPGFGAADRPIPPGFGLPREEPSSSQKPLEQRYDKKVIEYVDGMIKKYDKNGNGFLDPEEWSAVPWRGNPKESDSNHDGRLSRGEICERIAKRFAAENKARDQKAAADKAAAASAGARGSSADAARIRTYAESLLRQYDDNRNGRLEREEWSRMRGNWAEADRNGDGLLTLDEIINHLTKYSRGNGAGKTAAGPHRSYRFLSPTERLPSGLPAWFSRSDVDGDGQVTLAEYAPTGDSAKLTEFAKYDLNGDGIITARECLAAEKAAPAKR
jgi:Ca2+-binding EF-hand superfamily protein